jgi:hypothetical protein
VMVWHAGRKPLDLAEQRNRDRAPGLFFLRLEISWAQINIGHRRIVPKLLNKDLFLTGSIKTLQGMHVCA